MLLATLVEELLTFLTLRSTLLLTVTKELLLLQTCETLGTTAKNKMPPVFGDGNKLSSCTGRSPKAEGEVDSKPASPPRESKDKSKLVRIGSRYFSKDVSTTRRFNFVVEVGKSPSGIRVKSLNDVVSEKQREFKPVNKRLPTFPGDSPPQERPKDVSPEVKGE